MNALVIANTQIRRDPNGRYCLNDLHQASGGANRHRPSLWLDNQQTRDLVGELASDSESGAGIPAPPPVETVQRGLGQGTYAVKELVYAYAMWISPKFHLAVIRAYDALVTGSYAMPEAPRHEAGSELPPAPAHRGDYLVAANRSFAALLRAGRLFGLGQRAAARRANAATEALTGVNLAELLGADALIDEPEPAPLTDPGAREREYLRAWLEGRDEVTNDDVVDALGLPRDRASYMRAAFSMHRLGWVKTRTLNADGGRTIRYRRPGFDAGDGEAVPA